MLGAPLRDFRRTLFEWPTLLLLALAVFVMSCGPELAAAQAPKCTSTRLSRVVGSGVIAGGDTMIGYRVDQDSVRWRCTGLAGGSSRPPVDTIVVRPPADTATPVPLATWGADVSPTAAKLLGPYPGPLSRLSPIAKAHRDRWWLAANKQWTRDGAAWGVGNYYDRAFAYMADAAWRGQLGNPRDTAWSRGVAMWENYRDKYLLANACGASPHWLQIEAGMLHYLVTRDTVTKRALLCTAPKFGGFSPDKMGDSTYIYTEGRIQARTGLAALAACLADSTSATGMAMRGKWVTLNNCAWSDSAATNAVKLQRADGSYRWRISDDGVTPQVWGDSHFMHGLQDGFLLLHARLRGTVPVEATLRKSAAYFKRTWLPTQKQWTYWSPTPYDPTKPTFDVNVMVAPSLAWACGHDSDAAACAIWDTAVSAATAKGYFDGGKQINELAWWFWLWVALRYGGA